MSSRARLLAPAARSRPSTGAGRGRRAPTGRRGRRRAGAARRRPPQRPPRRRDPGRGGVPRPPRRRRRRTTRCWPSTTSAWPRSSARRSPRATRRASGPASKPAASAPKRCCAASAQTLEELSGLRQTLIHETERQMVQLALALARRVVHREVTPRPGAAAALARVALERLGDNAPATIRLHPEDYTVVAAGQRALGRADRHRRARSVDRARRLPRRVRLRQRRRRHRRAVRRAEPGAARRRALIAATATPSRGGPCVARRSYHRCRRIARRSDAAHRPRRPHRSACWSSRAGPRAQVGELCELQQASGRRLPLEVVGFRDGFVLTVPLGDTAGIRPGDRIVARGGAARVAGRPGAARPRARRPRPAARRPRAAPRRRRQRRSIRRRSIRWRAIRSSRRWAPASAPSTRC